MRPLTTSCLSVALLTVLLLAGCASASSPTPADRLNADEPTAIAIVGEDGEVWHELATRLLTPRYPGAPSPAETPPGQVFAPTTPQTTLCRGDDDLSLSIAAFDSETGPTDVRLYVTAAQYTLCQNAPGGVASYAQSVLPRLTSPPDAIMRSSGAGSNSDGSAYASADFESKLSVAELAAHYQPQLEAAGWQLTKESKTEFIAWSAWALTDTDVDEWTGMLLVTASPALPDGRFVMVRLDRQK